MAANSGVDVDVHGDDDVAEEYSNDGNYNYEESAILDETFGKSLK